MTKAYLITRCVLDNPVKHHQTEHNNSSLLHALLRYLMKITSNLPQISQLRMQKSSQLRYVWLEILLKSADQNILFRLDSFENPYKQLELVFHWEISKHSKTMDKNTRVLRRARVFTIIFSCLDIPVKHSLSLFIYYL